MAWAGTPTGTLLRDALIRGDTLGDAIRRYHAHEPPASAPAERHSSCGDCWGISSGLQYHRLRAVRQGVLHRDLKPGNILLGPYGQTVVVNWGLAKLIGARGPETVETAAEAGDARPGADAETLPGQVMGTPKLHEP